VGAEQIFLTKAPQQHAGWSSVETPYRILYICFQQNVEYSALCSEWRNIYDALEKITHPVTYDHFQMHEIHAQLMREIQNPENRFQTEILDTLIRQFILLTLRNFSNEYQGNVTRREFEEDNLVNRVIQYIHENIFAEINLKGISFALNYSIPHLCRHFKEQTGFSIMAYSHLARMERARKLLLLSQSSISDIAVDLGFSSIHHFSNAFKSMYGSSPVTFRKTNAAEQANKE
jgi:AraC-like DNA-binding protein